VKIKEVLNELKQGKREVTEESLRSAYNWLINHERSRIIKIIEDEFIMMHTHSEGDPPCSACDINKCMRLLINKIKGED
jgi:hypothetical protein